MDSEGVTIERKLESPGDGTTFPQRGDTVLVHYDGFLDSGVKFDSSYDRGSPMEAVIGVGKLIQGWDVGIPQLSLHEKATLVVKSHYGYGEGGYPPIIPPNATLKFEVELLEIKKTK